MPQIHEKNWGTLDAALVLLHLGKIFLWDYKNGHRQCDPEGHEQLIDYIAGIKHDWDIDGNLDQRIDVSITVVQPFCFTSRSSVRTWNVKLSDLRAEFNHLNAMAHESQNDPKLTAGLWCRDCRANLPCHANRRQAYELIDAVNLPYEFDEMTPRDLAVEYGLLKKGKAVLEARYDAVAAQLRHELENGAKGTGKGLKQSKGRTRWEAEPDVVVSLAAQFGLKVGETSVPTPKQVLDQLPAAKRSQFKTLLPQFTKTDPGGITIVDAADTVAARAFGGKNNATV